MDGIANHFSAQNALQALLRNFAYTSTKNCRRCYPRRSAPGAWTQTPISARLASISIVPVLRNDHCSSQYIFRYQFWLIKFLFFLNADCVCRFRARLFALPQIINGSTHDRVNLSKGAKRHNHALLGLHGKSREMLSKDDLCASLYSRNWLRSRRQRGF